MLLLHTATTFISIANISFRNKVEYILNKRSLSSFSAYLVPISRFDVVISEFVRREDGFAEVSRYFSLQ
ncbi:hypothetical protein GCWU000325_01127 [Alloprevotella tannerae ATCC 51259]|uniref:Uncharacterized protein n=1 Tax=Alloprevotella tannerae ATCC 51259 TaxID=626522 RepID=C9LFY9_9BACT|nr:hypothetical protein GCWU000325_01127 [Alloprevotella tannerae ATCC 51259]